MRKSGLLNPFLLLLCWTLLIGAGTFVLIQTSVKQRIATGYAVTRGRIVRSEIGQGSIIRRGVEVEYTYAVNGVKYDGHRYRYDDHNMTFEWNAAIEERPRWSSQRIYYNPKNPADSVLQPGIDGGDLLLLLFALPLNVLTVTLWYALVTRWRDLHRIQPAGGVRIVKQTGKTRVPLGQTSPLGAAFYALSTVAFVAAFPVVIVGGFDPSVHLMETTWTMVLAVGVAVFLWCLARNLSGIYELRIDPASQTVILPKTAGRSEPMSLPRGEISGVSLQRRVSQGPSGIQFSYLPALNHNGSGDGHGSMKLITWGWSEQKAHAFGKWLSEELNVEFKGIQEEIPAKS